jgi:PPOX class probable F420-dependent enzyme
MGVAIPDNVKTWLDGKTFWHLVTLGPDGSPQSTPVWGATDGTHVLVNTAKGRAKDRNMRRDGRVALSAINPENPYEAVEIRGKIVDVVDGQTAEDDIDDLAEKYLGQRPYPYRTPTEERVIFKVEPTYFGGYGG